MTPTKTFHCLEQAIERVEARFPGTPRQEVILTRLFYHIVPRLSALLNDCLKEHGLNETVWMGLLALYSCPEQTLYPSDLSDTLDSSRTNATRVADELVKHGWAERTPCEEDRRKVRLELTPAGVVLIETLLPIARQRHIAQWEEFNQQEKDTLEKLMRKLLASLED